MRPILALAILLLAVSSAATEPEIFPLLPGAFSLGGAGALASLVEIESSRASGDREPIAAPAPADLTASIPPAPVPPQAFTPDADPDTGGSPPLNDSNGATPTLDHLCNALLTSAQANGLPVAFFANLLWQESGLRNDIVSSKGAMGIAQFMPQTAEETGLLDPFDPLQAIPASARLLHALRDQFGNLGLVAAAYNAGPRRVSDWLDRHRRLPRETRGYVINITGRSVEQWRNAPPADAALRLMRQMPCRDLPAFAELEQARQSSEQAAESEKPDAAGDDKTGRFAERKHLRALLRRAEAARPDHEGSGANGGNHAANDRGHHAIRARQRV